MRRWLADLSVKTHGVAAATPEQPPKRLSFIEPGSPWENGYMESFNGKLRDELLDGEIFDTLFEAQVLVERWRRYYNTEEAQLPLGRSHRLLR